MRPLDWLRISLQALLFPQQCVLCQGWTLRPDWSPLCGGCQGELEVLPGRICAGCGIPVPGNILEEQACCAGCRRQPPPFDFARAYGPYQGRLRRLLWHFKFRGEWRLRAPLGELLQEALQRWAPQFRPHWIVPVPLHPVRRRQRGFDQTLLLARELSRRLGCPVFQGVKRIRATRPQVGLDRRQRRCNVRGAFALREGSQLKGSRLLLLDDVLTSGTTVSEVSRILRPLEVAEIGVLTVARVPLLY